MTNEENKTVEVQITGFVLNETGRLQGVQKLDVEEAKRLVGLKVAKYLNEADAKTAEAPATPEQVPDAEQPNKYSDTKTYANVTVIKTLLEEKGIEYKNIATKRAQFEYLLLKYDEEHPETPVIPVSATPVVATVETGTTETVVADNVTTAEAPATPVVADETKPAEIADVAQTVVETKTEE